MSDPITEHKLPFLENGLWQIGLVVEDLDSAVEAYSDLFGIGPWHVYTYQKPLLKRMTYRGKPGNYKMRVALAKIGPLQIELIQPLEGESIYAEFIREHGYGIHHIAVTVDDLESAVAQAEALGLEHVMGGGGHGLDNDGGFAYLGTESLLGTTLELVDLPKRRVQPDRVYPPAEES